MTTIYIRDFDPERQTARVSVVRPRKTHRKAWRAHRVRHLTVTAKWLEGRTPKGGMKRLRVMQADVLAPAVESSLSGTGTEHLPT